MLKAKKSVLFIFLFPAVFCYILVFLYPVLRTTVMSFFDVESVSDSFSQWSFNGLDNFKKIFTTPLFIRSLKNIGRIWLFGGCAVMCIALIFAVTLTGNLKGTGFFRSVIYFPNVISAVAMGTMWINYVYNSDYGFLHTVFQAAGLEAASHTLWTAPGIRFWSMLAAYCFGMAGYHMLIFISGIEQIPRDYYKAALLEGANVFQRFFHITLPNMKGVIRTNIVMWTVFTAAFFVWGQLFNPINLSGDTAAPMNYMYDLVFGAATTARNTGSGAAIGVVLMLIVIAVSLGTTFIVRRDDAEV